MLYADKMNKSISIAKNLFCVNSIAVKKLVLSLHWTNDLSYKINMQYIIHLWTYELCCSDTACQQSLDDEFQDRKVIWTMVKIPKQIINSSH